MTAADINFILVVAMLVLFALAIALRDVLKAVISLAAGSTVLAGIFYLLKAPFAAVFEVIIAAGLITILFILVISLTRPGGEE